MKRILASTCTVLMLAAGSAFAQAKAITGVPEIPFTTVPDFLKLPPGEYLGESVAVATNSRGNVFVFHRRDTTRLFEFDKNGNFLREIGKGERTVLIHSCYCSSFQCSIQYARLRRLPRRDDASSARCRGAGWRPA